MSLISYFIHIRVTKNKFNKQCLFESLWINLKSIEYQFLKEYWFCTSNGTLHFGMIWKFFKIFVWFTTIKYVIRWGYSTHQDNQPEMISKKRHNLTCHKIIDFLANLFGLTKFLPKICPWLPAFSWTNLLHHFLFVLQFPFQLGILDICL